MSRAQVPEIRIPATPRTQRKRVRYSDPGLVSGSTGLTPAMKRSTLTLDTSKACPPTPSRRQRRRVSFPLPDIPFSGEVQFAPLRQLLDARVKRRIRRNHLSEEINSIEACRREEARRRSSLRRTISTDGRIRGKELPMDDRQDIDVDSETCFLERDDDFDCINETDATEADATTTEDMKEENRLIKSPSSSCPSGTSQELEITPITRRPADDDCLDQPFNLQQRLDSSLKALKNDISALGFRGDTPEEMIATIKDAFRQARLRLERMEPGEIPGGFESSRFLDIATDRVAALLRRAQKAEALADQNNQLRATLQRHFDGSLFRTGKLERENECFKKQLFVSNSQQQLYRAELNELTAQRDEQTLSIEKLELALDMCHSEVSVLESTLKEKDAEIARILAQKIDADEAVADLESKLEDEQREHGDTMAERNKLSELVNQLKLDLECANNRISEIQCDTQELLRCKEVHIQALREDLSQQGENQERFRRETDSTLKEYLQEAARLRASLADADALVGTLEKIKAELEARLAEETRAGKFAIESIQSEMVACLARCTQKRDDYLRAHDCDQNSIGLLTPVSNSGKFEPFGGAETPCKRKKRKYDSGIFVIDEDEEDEE
ncbi:hypothetical protein L228DRAFT_235351 [Xylona heveae TC161]|uniref:Uncharacterized protein n=1 Tax=Xylona heveae (strain CBS 132557 / TC161) TaxID=1328760 RepID=A0A165JHS6_XYLHT|nr:hypothetical protein L228DRAFT_235351 [Xylona heveae TC161]KZF26256.1 hypothetical protein L228DRAFT_235351 [Xylona heveae TC161]